MIVYIHSEEYPGKNILTFPENEIAYRETILIPGISTILKNLNEIFKDPRRHDYPGPNQMRELLEIMQMQIRRFWKQTHKYYEMAIENGSYHQFQQVENPQDG